MIQHAVLADKMGITLADADSLLNGRAYATVSNALGVPMGYIDSFINNGSASAALANCLGVNISATEELGTQLGREGRIGLIFGLLMARQK
jgi:hypothetical protein